MVLSCREIIYNKKKEVKQMGRDIIARGMASGAIKVNINAGHIFVDNTARDAYFVTNPTELLENMYVYCDSKLQQYDGSTWTDRTLAIKGETGIGVPTGGTTNQVLTKNSNGDYDFSWVDLSGGGDMFKSFYDTANKQADVYDMDNMEDGTTYVRTENNFTNDYKNKIDDNVLKSHTHENKTILDNISGTNTGDETNATIISKIGYTPENTLNKGVNNGYCALDSGGKVPLQNLPSTLLKYIGTWNAETNTPSLTDTDLTKVSYVYVVSHDGTQFGITWKAGDWLIYDADGMVEKSDNSDDVVSVNGKTGIVVINKADVGLSNVDNTSDLDKPISTLTQTALNLKADNLDLTTHISNTDNPHNVNKDDIGLSNVANVDTTTTANITDSTDKRFVTDANLVVIGNTSNINTGDETNETIKTKLGTDLSNKVDKVDGKGLSANDFTAVLKAKLDGIAENANNYTLPIASTDTLGGVKVDGTTVTIANGVISAPGADGQDGADGMSAYEVAVLNGYVGTQSEWLLSLKGEQGIQGEKGDKGDKGDTGIGVPIGTILTYSATTPPVGFLVCNGSEVSKTTYADLFNIIGNTYGTATDPNKFKLPDLRDKFVQGANGNLGTSKAAGLPNITGETRHISEGCVWSRQSSGAFDGYVADTSKEINNVELSANKNYGYYFRFDASRSNAIYGKSNTVQPPSICLTHIIKH